MKREIVIESRPQNRKCLESTASETAAFVRELLGLPTPGINTSLTESADQRQLREFVTAITCDQTGEPITEAQQRQFLASISTAHESMWDPAKHPRGGYPDNPGQFSPSGAAVGSGESQQRGTTIMPSFQAALDSSKAIHPEQGSRPGNAGAHDFLAQNPPPRAAGGQPQPVRSIIRLRGNPEPKGGGRVPGTDIDVGVHRNVTIAPMINGVLLRDPNGNILTDEATMQLEANSRNVDRLHWIQFYKVSEYDVNGRPVAGGSVSDDRTAYHQNGKWHVDMPLPPAQGQADPNGVYYDHPPSDNAYSRTRTNLSIFDRPSEGTLSPEARRKEVEFKSYLVDETGPRWETSWKHRTVIDAQGIGTETIDDIKGQPINRFAEPLNTSTWNVANRVEPLNDGTTRVRIHPNTTQATNPFFKK
jgi:hypothetical protein